MEGVNKKELQEMALKPFMWVGYLCLLFFIIMIFSPLLWIWYGFSLFAKIGLSSLIVYVIFALLYQFIKKSCNEAVDEFIKDSRFNKTGTSRFQRKLEEKMRQAKEEQSKRTNQ